MKKYVSLVLAIIIFCCFLVGCTPSHLQQYRESAKNELTEYVQEKLQHNFSTENVYKINEYFQQSVSQINIAENENDIKQIVLETKVKIDGVEEEKLSDDVKDIVDVNDDNYPEFVNEVLLEFVNTLQIADITKVEYFYSYGSINFAPPDEKTTTTLQSDIEIIYQWLKGLTFVESNMESVEGGSSVLLKIYTEKNVFKIVNCAGEDFLWCYGKRYEKHSPIPKITGETTTYVFSAPETYCYLVASPNIDKTYEFDFNEVECKVITDTILASEKLYRCQTPIGMIYLYDFKHFERYGTVYEVINGLDFSQIFIDYPAKQPLTLNSESILSCEVKYDSSFYYSGDNGVTGLRLEIINSYQEFLAIYPQGADYNEEFFDDNFLVIVTCYTPHSGVRYYLDSVYQEKNETIIRLIYEECGAGAAALGEYYVTMEFSKGVQINQSTTYVTVLHPICYSYEECN